MIYLASPYSHQDPAIVHRRYVAACKATAELMKWGEHVFSPIAHSHVVAEVGDFHTGWEFWQKIDFEWIRMCGYVYVLMLDGWDRSVGVTAELRYALSLQIPVTWVLPSALGIEDVV